MIAGLVAAVALLLLPAALDRVGRGLAPREWAWLCAVALGAGALLIEAVLLLRAAPGVLAAAGLDAFASACTRVLGPLVAGGATLTWAVSVLAAALPATGAVALWRGHRLRRRLAGDLWLGEQQQVAGRLVVVLPVSRPLAVSFHHPEPVIVVSRGIVDLLGGDELAAVVRHEAAHLDHRHQRFQTVRLAVAPLLGRLAGVRRSLAALDLAVERWADEVASGDGPEARDAVRRSLLRLTGIPAPSGVAAFADPATIAARIDALAAPAPAMSAALHPLVYLPGLAAVAIATPAVLRWTGQTAAVLALAGRCML